MARIQQLSPSVINKIAAGEVIERPASVVKELLENSVDAGATRIEIDIVDGGSELIRIVDNGDGIHPDDVLLAVTSHATSKLAHADDLFRVHTMGFRGEALASIAEVSQFRIRSRQADSEAGVELEVHAGDVQPVKDCGCPVGTSIEVRQLFCNTPVRRKFLKSSGTELGHICEHFTRIALANPRLHLVLKHNQKLVYELPATDSLLERLQLFYGKQLAEKLIWIEGQQGDIRLWGYVAHPSQNKPTRKGQYFFLNGRWITDRTLQHSLTEAYRGLVMIGRYPIAFLFLELPPGEVDVNVHPTKQEVRFQDTQVLFRLILSTIRTKFLSLDLDGQMKLPSASAPVAPAKGPTVDPQLQFERQQELAEWAKSELERARQRLDSPHPETAGTGPIIDPPLEDWQSDVGQSPASWGASGSPADQSLYTSRNTGWPETTGWSPDLSPLASEQAPTEPPPLPPLPTAMTSPGTSLPPEVDPAPDPVRAMQVHDCYLVVETNEGIIVIDQHALHERIMYEQLRTRVLAGSVESQRLLMPEPVELSPSEAALLLEQSTLLADVGFGIEEFGGNTVLLTRYPVMLGRLNQTNLLKDLAQHIADNGRSPSRRDLLDSLLHMMSCKAAIKAGQRLTSEEIDKLLALRHMVDDAHHCPHGRPTALKLSRAELDRQFGRLG